MLSLNKLKTFLEISEENTSKDELLKACIAGAAAEFNGLVNRELDYKSRTETINGSGTRFAYLKNYPVGEVSALRVITNNSSDDIIRPPDTISDSLMIFDTGILFLRKGYFFSKGEMNIQVEYESGYLDADDWKSGSKYFEKDRVKYNGIIYECIEAHIAEEIFDERLWTRLAAFPAPDDLLKAIKYLAARQFYDSPAGKNLLAKKAESVGGLASKSIVYKDIEIEHIINSYKKVNV